MGRLVGSDEWFQFFEPVETTLIVSSRIHRSFAVPGKAEGVCGFALLLSRRNHWHASV